MPISKRQRETFKVTIKTKTNKEKTQVILTVDSEGPQIDAETLAEALQRYVDMIWQPDSGDTHLH